MRITTRLRWVLLGLAVVAAACTPQDIQAAKPSGTLEVVADVRSDNALLGEVRFSTVNSVAPVVSILDEDGTERQVTTSESATEHVFPLLGLRPDTSYTIRVEADGQVGTTTLNTGSLPADLPPLEVDSQPDRMTPGLTLFNAIPFAPGQDRGETDDGYLLAVDPEGNVVWYYRQAHSIQDVRRTQEGDLLFIHHETGVRQLDPATGEMVEWSGTTGLESAPEDPHGRAYAGDDAIRVETDQMHHEVIELPNGNLMTLSREMRQIDGFPEDLCGEGEEFDGSYQVVADSVVEFVPETGEIVKEWPLFDYLDPLAELDRIRPSEFCSQYLSDVYPDQPARDWTHANAVVLDAERNALLVSVRHLDLILALRYADDESGPAGELLWRLGRGGDFTLEEGEWFLHQHAPQVLADGSIMIYDNGNERPGTSLDDPDDLPYSRAVQYQIDTEEMTARQVWAHRFDSPGEAVYAPFVGDADMLAGDTVLITHGGQIDPPAHTPLAEGALVWGEVIEAEYPSGEVVFDLRMKDPAGELGWIIYRAERIETLYPGGYTVEQIGG